MNAIDKAIGLSVSPRAAPGLGEAQPWVQPSHQNCDCIAAEPVKSSLRALTLVGWVGSII
jgi:hypothetical protein